MSLKLNNKKFVHRKNCIKHCKKYQHLSKLSYSLTTDLLVLCVQLNIFYFHSITTKLLDS